MIELSLLALGSASFSFMFKFFTQEGMILEFWNKGLIKLMENGYGFLAYPLGYCVYCFNFWITVFSFALTYDYSSFGLTFFIYLFLATGISNTFLTIINALLSE